MPITITCTHCRSQLQLQEAHLGKQVRCPACQQIFTAAAPPPAEPEEVPEVSAFETPEPSTAPVTPARPSQRRQPQDSLDFERETRERMEEAEDDEEPVGMQPHRGGLVLTMGILTLVFAFCCPPLCWIIGGIGENMAGKDLRMMSLRHMDRSGRGLTQTGKTLMGVGIALSILLWIGITILRFTVFRR